MRKTLAEYRQTVISTWKFDKNLHRTALFRLTACCFLLAAATPVYADHFVLDEIKAADVSEDANGDNLLDATGFFSTATGASALPPSDWYTEEEAEEDWGEEWGTEGLTINGETYECVGGTWQIRFRSASVKHVLKCDGGDIYSGGDRLVPPHDL
jgi:hypothetical protein